MKSSTKKSSKKRDRLADDEDGDRKKKKKSAKPSNSKKSFDGKTKTLKSILLNRNNSLNVGIMTFEGNDHKFVDIRKYYQDAGGEFKPTGKGVAFDVKHLPAVIQALKKLARKYPVEVEDGEDEE